MCESLGPYPNYYEKTNSANVMINDNEQLVVMRGAYWRVVGIGANWRAHALCSGGSGYSVWADYFPIRIYAQCGQIVHICDRSCKYDSYIKN